MSAHAKVAGATDMLYEASVLKGGLKVRFVDGFEGMVQILKTHGLDPAAVTKLELPSAYLLRVTVSETNVVDIPSDSLRYHSDPAYRTEQAEGARRSRESFGAHLRRMREGAGLSQGDLAEHAGLDRGTVIRLEGGQFSPRMATITALAAALGVRFEDLVTVPE